MKRLRYSLVLLPCLFMLSFALTVEAQSCTDPFTGGTIPCPPAPPQPGMPDLPDADGDGTPDSTDQCLNQSGPNWNGGCPTEADTDGDGTPDSTDQCPNQGGPDWNNGCPTNESPPVTTENLPALPQFPIDPDARDENGSRLPCLVATRTLTPVNLREQHNINSPVKGILNPFEPEYATYRHVVIRGGLVEEWYTTLRFAHAASWVTRLSPQCDDRLTTFYFNYTREQLSVVVEGLDLSGYAPESVLEQTAITRICPDFNTVLLPTDALTDCSGNAVSPAPNGERFLCDDTWVAAFNDCTFSSLPIVLIGENAQLLAITLVPPNSPVETSPPPDDEQMTLLFGNGLSLDELSFNPQPEPPASPDAKGLFVILALGNLPDVNLVGFNPQPEPPEGYTNFGLLLGVNFPDINRVGFNPQPEPPAILTGFGQYSLIPTETGYQLINTEGVGAEIGLVDTDLISVDDLTLWNYPDMPAMTLWTAVNDDMSTTTIMCPGSEVSFNPQPEPPALDACFSITPMG